jgi:hypothetical protein
MPLRGVLLLLFLSRSDVKTHPSMDNHMLDTDTIRIPSVTSFTFKNTILRRGLAKEIIAKRNDHRALYNISLTHHISLQAVGYISRCRLKDIEKAPAIRP